MAKPRALVLRAAGSNCDAETEYAFAKAGAEAERVHVNRLLEASARLDDYQIFAVPGGFTYGDDIAAGKILANQLVHHLADSLKAFVERGGLVLGICNGFQVLAKMGLLPGIGNGRQTATLAANDSGRFEARWVRLESRGSNSVFFPDEARITLPVAHGEGKFVAREESILDALETGRQVVFRYVAPDGGPPSYPENPNGSQRDIAGVSDPTGRVLGMMPHPERYVEPTHHPRWTREGLDRPPQGLAVFTNAVRHFK
jgi:phosphoribosylformylglycinamidine synthase